MSPFTDHGLMQISDRVVLQFPEICHGEEHSPDAKEDLHALLRHIDNFLQRLTLGISAAHPRQEEWTTAHYRELPALTGSPMGAGSGTEFCSGLLFTLQLPRADVSKAAIDPLRLKLPALGLQIFTDSISVHGEGRQEAILYNKDLKSILLDKNDGFAGPACIRIAELTRTGLRYSWPPVLYEKARVGWAGPDPACSVWLEDDTGQRMTRECA